MINHPWQAAHEPLDMSAQGIMKLIQLIKDLTGQSQALEMPPPPPPPYGMPAESLDGLNLSDRPYIPQHPEEAEKQRQRKDHYERYMDQEQRFVRWRQARKKLERGRQPVPDYLKETWASPWEQKLSNMDVDAYRQWADQGFAPDAPKSPRNRNWYNEPASPEANPLMRALLGR